MVSAISFQFPFDSAAAAAASPDTCFSYFGTYTAGKSKGIYVARFDTRSGKFNSPELAAEAKNPSFLAVHPNKRWLYAANEVENFEGKPQGAISAFRIDEKSGQLEFINSQSSGGAGPCHLALDSTGACLLVANYGSGSIAALVVRPDGGLNAPNGSIQHHGSSINAQRQAGPHAHFITPDPSNKYALTCDLGLDQVLIYQLSPATASLTANDPSFVALKPGSGPRHLAFHPNGRFAYVINEMSSTITTFSYDSRNGTLHTLETHSTLPPEFKGENSCAEIQLHPSGRFLYGSNRGHNSIALFGINPKDGRLQRGDWINSGGKTPRHFTLDPTGKWLVAENQDSDNAVIFAVNPTTGELKATGEDVGIGAPVCLVFVR